MNYNSYIQTLAKTHLTLADKWWAMYHDDFHNMKAELQAEDHLRFQEQNLHMRGPHREDSYNVISSPRSISILKKILLTRAVGDESIKIKGLVDAYFFTVATAPEIRNSRISSQTFKVFHTIEADEFYTSFKFFCFDRPKTRKSFFKGENIAEALKDNHIVRFFLTGLSLGDFSLFIDMPKFQCGEKVLVILLKKIEHTTIRPTLQIGNRHTLKWRLQFEEGFSITLSQGLEPEGYHRKYFHHDGFGHRVMCRRKFVDDVYGSGVGESVFFMIEYQDASFVMYKEDSHELYETISLIFRFLCFKEIALTIELNGNTHNMIYDHCAHIGVARYLAQDYHVIGDKCYERLKSQWAGHDVCFEEELSFIFRRGTHNIIKQIKDTHIMINLTRILPCYHKHVIRKMANDKKTKVEQDTNNPKNLMLFFEDSCYRKISHFGIKSLCDDILNFSVHIRIYDPHVKEGIRQGQDIKTQIKEFISSIVIAMRQSKETQDAIQGTLCAIIEDNNSARRTLSKLQVLGRLRRKRVQRTYRHLFFLHSRHFCSFAVQDAVIIHTGSCDLIALQAIQDLVNLVNLLYFFSLEAAAFENKISWEEYFVERCLVPEDKIDTTVVLVLSFSNIVKWLKSQLLGEDFNHLDIVREEIARQKDLFKLQTFQARQMLKRLDLSEEDADQPSAISFILSISYLFDI